jgi:hypothetical protein
VRGTGAGAQSHDRGRTPAQWYCLLAGAALLGAGLLGFIVDSAFDTGNGIDGGKLLGIFEVNGWHNIVHILSGIVLLAASPKRASAKAVAIAFGVVYGLVTIIGLIDGSDVFGIIPINPGDNILHIALSLAGIVAGLVSDADDRGTATGGSSGGTGLSGASDTTDRTRITRDVDPLSGDERNPSSSTPTTRRT